MTKSIRRYSERIAVAVRPKMRQDLERIAADLDEPVTDLLREWLERCIQSHDRHGRRARATARPEQAPEKATQEDQPSEDRQGCVVEEETPQEAPVAVDF